MAVRFVYPDSKNDGNSVFLILVCICAFIGTFSIFSSLRNLFNAMSYAYAGTKVARRDLPAVQVLTFPDKPPQCPALEMYNQCHKNGCRLNHSENTSWFQICHLINSATKSVDVAIMNLTSHKVTNILLTLHRRGVRVRILVDAEMALHAEGALRFVEMFRDANISVRTQAFLHGAKFRIKGTFHHRFLVIDEEVVLTGSLNFTLHGVLQNYEDVVIIRIPAIVDEYGGRFQEIWNKMPNSVYDLSGKDGKGTLKSHS